MSLRIKQANLGKLSATIYDFENVGDVLPMHRHSERDVHITIIARGSLRIHGPEIGDKVYNSGAVLDWEIGVDHEFVSVSDNARIVNILKN